MTEQEPKRIKVENTEASVVQRDSLLRANLDECIALEEHRRYVHYRFIMLAIGWSGLNIGAEITAQISARLQQAGLIRSPQGNTRIISELLAPWWSILKQYLLRSVLLHDQFIVVLKQEAPTESLVPWLLPTKSCALVGPLPSQICPLSGLPIQYAVRPAWCKHSQCFDLNSYLQYYRERINLVPIPPVKYEPNTAARPSFVLLCPICKSDTRAPWFLVYDCEYEHKIQKSQIAAPAVVIE